MKLLIYILILIFNIAIYLLPSYLILKRRKYSLISVRSPKLLFINNLGGFLMTTTSIIYEIIEHLNENGYEITKDDFLLFCKILPNNYLIFHFMLMVSFLLRCHRVIQCCKINIDERTQMTLFYNKRYLLKESHYVKLLFFFIASSIFITILLNIKVIDIVIVPAHYTQCIENNHQKFVNLIIWVVINFTEHIILLTYTYLIFINPIKQMIKIELIIFLIIWLIYPNLTRASELLFQVDISNNHWISIIGILFIYACLVVNSYMPLYFSYKDKESISYHFNSRLASNLYTYLSNDQCVMSFMDYLRDSEENTFYLSFYIDLFKFKLRFLTEAEYSIALKEAKLIYYKYFFDNLYDAYISQDVVNKVRNNCNQYLNREEITYEMFDEALCYTYEKLEKLFRKYRKSEEYQILIDNLNLNSYIQCKMCNTGLINKY